MSEEDIKEEVEFREVSLPRCCLNCKWSREVCETFECVRNFDMSVERDSLCNLWSKDHRYGILGRGNLNE